jgi:hypothetical protein
MAETPTPIERPFVQRWIGYGQHLYDVVLKPMGLRTLVLIGFGLLLLSHDWIAAKSFTFNLGLICFGLGLLQWTRKILMPYLDQAEVVKKACESAIGAALVFVATRAFDAVVLLFLLFGAIR